MKSEREELAARLKKYRMREGELETIRNLLGRDPVGLEWAIFSALWSEHCSYKSSKVHLKKLFRSSPRVLQSEGENAGVVDLGQGERVAFKMESHNHPSFIEPYQGAATGVGGILRDIFTMGARPLALGNYLCFGRPGAERMKSLVDGVVRGIGGYGNCVGVPTVTGQTEFHESYDRNILVNAFALGYFAPGDKVHLSQAQGVGNKVVYVGARTGRDGVHGAAMASGSFDSESHLNRPTVQIGDPFFEKLLIESCLEVMAEDLVVAIQDMGAAGLTSSSFEMAAKGGVGFKLDLSKVPLRDPTCGPEEILLSESQERMLLVAEPDKLPRIQAIFARWGLEACEIGEVTEDRSVELWWHGEKLAALDPWLVVENAPQYDRPHRLWTSPRRREWRELRPLSLESALAHVRSERGCSRNWIYQQYDSRVQTQTEWGCEMPFGIIRLPHSGRRVAIVKGCRPDLMRVDAELGGWDAVVAPVMKMALGGFEPVGVTDCLNFASPENPQIMTEFVASVRALSDAAQTFVAPIISGNVSFYNETLDRPITSTPATVVVGLASEKRPLPQPFFTEAGQQVYWLDPQLVRVYGDGTFSGDRDGIRARAWAELLRDLGSQVSAAKVCGEGGLAQTLLRMVVDGGVGLSLSSPVGTEESLYSVVVATRNSDFVSQWQARVAGVGGRIVTLGQTQPDRVSWSDGQQVHVFQLKDVYESGWGQSGLPS